MKRSGKTLLSALCALALVTTARAVVGDSGTATPASDTENGDSPYSAIWLRNVFDLKAPLPPVTPPAATAPPVNVTLTGITTLLGTKRALFLVQEPPAPGKPPSKEESCILTEGQRQGVLEVLEINPKAGSVKIKNDNNISTITFATNKTAGGGLGGGPGPMPMGMPYQPRFNFNPNNQPPVVPPIHSPMPTRTTRGQFTPTGAPSLPYGAYQTGYGMASGGAAAANSSLPNPAPPPQPPTPAFNNLPAEKSPSQITPGMLASQQAAAGLPSPSQSPTYENSANDVVTPPTDQGNGSPLSGSPASALPPSKGLPPPPQ